MASITWDGTGERLYETGVDHGVLYIPNTSTGEYEGGVAWNGLTTVTESPSGAESNPQYADNIKYLNLVSAEDFGATIEAFTYPPEFAQCDGTATPAPGVAVGQQTRKTFGMAYRTLVGNDIQGQDFGYKLHLIYGATAAPSEKAYATINDSPEALNFSWDVTTIPVEVGTVGGITYKPTASLTIDSTQVDADALADLEAMLYGGTDAEPSLPQPADVLAIFVAATTEVTPQAPTFNSGTNTITIPVQTGVVYLIDGSAVTGTQVITEDTTVTASPQSGYSFPGGATTSWPFTFSG